MRNIWRLFVGDLRRLRSNVVSIIAVIGLVALPSIFSWYNMLACWNVFDNTGNLTVAVANCDEGYESDLVPLKVNIGDRVIAALRENDQLNWVFTNEEDAVDGARSGRYYAAVVIPPSFSSDMMSFYTPDAEHASIVYYSNEKKSAVAPKVTDQGADQVARQINMSFTETLSEVALGISSAILDYADNTDMSGAMSNVGGHLTRAGGQLSDAASVVALYADALGSARALIDDAGTLLKSAGEASKGVIDPVREARAEADGIPDTVDEASEALLVALEQGSQGFAALPAAVDAAFESGKTLGADSVSELRALADSCDALAGDYRAIAALLQQLKPSSAEVANDIAVAVKRMNELVALQEQLRDALRTAASDIEGTSGSVESDRAAVIKLANQVKADASAAHSDYEDNLVPAIDRLLDEAQRLSSTLADAGSKLEDATGRLGGAGESLSQKLSDVQGELRATADELAESGRAVTEMGERVSQAVLSGDADILRQVIGSDPSTLAQAVSAPIALDRRAVYPVENFGSAMSPLYTTLALWIGALLIMVSLRLVPSERALSELDDPTLTQQFLGRFGVVGLLSFMQSTAIALGNLLFLGVQATHPFLYVLCFWVSGLAFTFIIYALVALFANFGKALSVILLIVQVSGGGGSFPMQLLPQFFQNVSPYLPITHAARAMRAAMFGMYNNDFWIEIGTLALFVVPFIVLGLALRSPLEKVVPRFVERVEESKLM